MKGVARICKVISQRRTSIHKPLTSFFQLMFASGKEENEKSLDYCTLYEVPESLKGKVGLGLSTIALLYESLLK